MSSWPVSAQLRWIFTNYGERIDHPQDWYLVMQEAFRLFPRVMLYVVSSSPFCQDEKYVVRCSSVKSEKNCCHRSAFFLLVSLLFTSILDGVPESI